MGYYEQARDWECCGIANAGGGIVAGGGIYLFEFRSRAANYRAVYTFMGVGASLGGGFGGTAAPSPGDFARPSVPPNLWSNVRGHYNRSFSAYNLNNTSGWLGTAGLSPVYGYALTTISAGTWPRVFEDQDVSGWGAGLGAGIAILMGMWRILGDGGRYY